MASVLRQQLAAVKTALHTIDGTGSFTYDLSGTDSVAYGIQLFPDIVPRVQIASLSETSTHGIPLGFYERTASISLFGYVGADSDEAGSRLLNATDLLNDMMLAIEADRTLGGLVLDVIFTNTVAMDGLEMDLPTLGLAEVVLQTRYTTKTGT